MKGSSAPSLFIVGWGRLGSAIGLSARDAGWRLSGAWNRSTTAAGRARRAGVAASRGDLPPLAVDLALLAVPDAAIAAVAGRVAGLPRRELPRVAAHLSGSLDLAPLAPLAEAGVAIGSLHPFCSVAGPRTILSGASCAIDGDPSARRLLRALARDLRLVPLRRPPRDRPRYHLAASSLASFTGALANRSEALLEASGVPPREARRALAALLRSVAANIEGAGAAGALTGPFARGDPEAVRRHLALLARDPPTLTLYRTLGRFTLDLAQRSDRGDPAGREAIRRLLKG